ncbi:grasp-with-spasm system SPASM domain peptide maturase [Olivibacter sp. CPCC 100613]|uniref:grasp-with-spasm system SPASM domain peptide maturase n=1 Tax=Olivibacter sp. CPCC 100613 TaxID=3079931 RepID=UPI002FFC6F37
MRVSSNLWFKMFACCVLVRGYASSLIYDVQRKLFYTISNEAFNLLKSAEDQDMEALRSNIRYDHSFLDSFYKQFVDAELGFYTDEPWSYPSIDFTWHSPHTITNSIIEISKQSDFSFGDIIDQLNELSCKAVQVRFLDNLSSSELNKYLDAFRLSRIKHLEIYLPYQTIQPHKILYKKLEEEPRLFRIIIYGCLEDKLIFSQATLGKAIIEVKRNIQINNKETIKPERFSTNIESFTEAQHYNLGLNRKVCIDRYGNIKNYIRHEKSFGSIKNIKIKDVILTSGFSEKWDVSNDKIEKCRDCQYRYTCVSNSDVVEKNGKYYKTETCDFDPYNNKWNNVK